MRLVVDANVVFAALLRDGPTRELTLHAPLELHAPAWVWGEMEGHIPEIVRRSGLAEGVVRGLLDRLAGRIATVPVGALKPHAREALRGVRKAGMKDAAYVACALAVSAAIWTHDGNLRAECGVTTVVTSELAARFLAQGT